MNPYRISIVIATFNSSGVLPLVLKSIQDQTFPRKEVEILIIDGGSTDKTLNIAKEFNCRIINNPKVEPVSAKLLGYDHAKGDYIVYLDADEVIENIHSLSLKLSVFEKDERIIAVMGTGYKDPPHAPFLTSYINDFGDPFSFFIYRLSKNSKFYYHKLKQLFPVLKEDSDSVIFDFSKNGNDLLHELGAGNNMIHLKYLKNTFPQFTSEIFAHLFQHLISQSKFIGMTKNDPVIHHTTTTLKGYINKITWRIKNNLFHKSRMGVSGYTGREEYHSSFLKFKKYFFIPYSICLILPFIDSIELALTRKKISYLLHLPLTLLSAYLVVWYYLLKLLGFQMILRNYDESKEIR